MQDKRRYVRMKTVFPVEFTVLNERREECSKHLLQGFTRDVSASGLCIELKSFGKQTEKDLSGPNGYLNLSIDPPFSRQPIRATGRIAWLRKSIDTTPERYFIGVDYTDIDEKARQRIVRYASRLLWLPRAAGLAGLVMLVAIGGLVAREQSLLMENRALVRQMNDNAEKKSDIVFKLVEIQNAKLSLSRELEKAREKIKSLQSKTAELEAQTAAEKEAYARELEAGLEKQKDIAERLKNMESGHARLESAYNDIQRSGSVTASAGLHQMFDWIKSHKNVRTGLVASYEGDAALEHVAFTYDLSLVAQTFLLFGDTESAEAILDFFDSGARQLSGAFFNAYDTRDRTPVESQIHVGPNIWVGIAALQHEHRVKSGRYLPMAKRIGDWLIRLQDEEGGVKGGPNFSWYSTEHNLDAYAFLDMLQELTGDVKYRIARNKSFEWIRKYAYSVSERRMNRGKGDATIATDTFSWAVAAIGPETLKQNDFDAEAIMEYAEEHCKVKTDYRQPGGKVVSVTGFDFAKAQNIGRGGIISCEWTAQCIVTYQVLSRYFREQGQTEKAVFYKDKADFYLSELQKLIISSPSKIGKGRGCLPYASADNADTGHGWRTPKGIRTGSLAATAYGIFAWTGYNPFDLKNRVDVQKGGE